MTNRALKTLLAPACAFILGACSTNGPSLTTGSLFSSSKPKPPAQKIVTPVDRAVHVGAISVRAQKCGYVFDPIKLKQDFLAAESALGTPPEMLTKAAQTYEGAGRIVARTIASDKNYCSSSRTEKIKKDLSRVLAGNFAPPKKNNTQINWWEDTNTGQEVINPEGVFDPTGRTSKTKRVPVQ